MYIVSEFQTNAGQTAILNYSFTEQGPAEQKYHEVLAYAAISEVELHAVSLMNEYGCVAKNEYYTHPAPDPEPEPEPTPEPDPEQEPA
jgi:hypothetical protein